MAAIAGWTLLPFTQAAQWQALLILTLFMAPTFQLIDSIIPKSSDATGRGHFTALTRDFAFATAMVAVKIVLMAHLAWMMGDAILRTLYRLFVSRKNMLEWRSASAAHKSGGTDLTAYYGSMRGAVLIALAGLMIPVAADSTGAFVAFFFAIFWAGSPAFAWLISRSARRKTGCASPSADEIPARRGAAHLGLFREPGDGRAEHAAARQFPGDARAGRRQPHLADQCRRLPALHRLGARLRLDQPC